MAINVNELFIHLGIERVKPLVTALLLPPLPFLALSALGLVLLLGTRRRLLGTGTLGAGMALTWLSCCLGVANWLGPSLLPLPAAITPERITELKHLASTPVAIIVLGAGVDEWAPEYRQSSLRYASLERLRYGLWLGRKTGWPVGFSGGVGWGQLTARASAAEATVAQRIATEEFGQPLRWVEPQSRDTRENARNTVRLLIADGIRHVVIVTSVWHMPRALRNFERTLGAGDIHLETAPMGLSSDTELPLLRWIPSGEGLLQTRNVTREWLGLLGGA